MTLTVQTDAGTVTAANSYATVAEFKTYHTDRGNSFSAYDDTAIAAALVRAASFLDIRFRYKGRKLNGRTQVTEWPRTNCYDSDRDYVNGVPAEVKGAQIEYALRSLTTPLAPDPEYSATGAAVQSKSEKVGPIEESVTYAQGAASGFSMPLYPLADRLLTTAGLVETSGNIRRG